MLRILPQKPLEVVSVQAAAGSIIHKAMRVFYQSRKVELEEYKKRQHDTHTVQTARYHVATGHWPRFTNTV